MTEKREVPLQNFQIPIQGPQGAALATQGATMVAPVSQVPSLSSGQPISKIYNRKNETVIIHDLVNSVTKEPLRLEPPTAGLPHVVDVDDRYGAKAVRSSDGIRRAIRDGLIGFVTPELEAQWDALRQQYLVRPESADANKNLNEKLDDIVGKIPRRRKRGEAINDPTVGGIEDPLLISQVTTQVKTKNEYDAQLVELREEMKHDIISS